MRPFLILLSAFASVAAITYFLTLAKPHCDDSVLKTTLLAIILFGQWLLLGGLLYLMLPKLKVTLLSVFVLLGLPLMAVIWVVSLWPPSIFGFAWAPFYIGLPPEVRQVKSKVSGWDG